MNKQITEDYVSYEIAQLLKEKGFDVPTENFYDNTGENLEDMKTIYGGTPDFGKVNWNADPFVCEGFPKLTTFSKPSQSLALKWLREVHNIHISINVGCNVDNKNYVFYTPTIVKLNNKSVEYIDPFCEDEDEFDNNEQAVEAAILYVLKNLI